MLRARIAGQFGRPARDVALDEPLDRLELDWQGHSSLEGFVCAIIRDGLGMVAYPVEIAKGATLAELARYLSNELEEVPPIRRPTDCDLPLGGLGWPAEGQWSIPGGGRNPKCVFVLCAPRSGSTLLRVMLAGNAGLFAPPELNLLPFPDMAAFAQRVADPGSEWMRLGLQHAFAAAKGLCGAAAERLLESLVAPEAPMKDVYAMLQQAVRPRVLVDKSPIYSYRLAWLEQAERLFDEPLYVHLVRHPVATMESFVRMRFHRLFGGDPWRMAVLDPWAIAERVWGTANANILSFLRGVPASRRHLVRYEDLVQGPGDALRELCVFLGVDFQEEMLRPYAGNRMTHWGDRRFAAIGDPNFLSHGAIEPSLASRWRERVGSYPLSATVRRLCSGFGYPTS